LIMAADEAIEDAVASLGLLMVLIGMGVSLCEPYKRPWHSPSARPLLRGVTIGRAGARLRP